MKPLRLRLEDARRRLGAPWQILERDYLLSWVLAGIVQVPTLRDTLAFKGGTALRKCYFGDYRLSEDLDFSGLAGVPTGAAMDQLVNDVCATATRLLNPYAPVEIVSERYMEREPHPGGQEAFTIRARLPWQPERLTRVIVEITVDEPVLWPVKPRRVIHDYGEPLEADVRVYALEEIVAEKLRAILQQVALIEKRGWSRSRARDYFDLWKVLGTYHDQLDQTGFCGLLQEKCAVRNVAFAGSEDFFHQGLLTQVARTWHQWLGPLVPELPPFASVVDELRPRVTALLAECR